MAWRVFALPLRDDGEVLFPGEAEPVAYESSVELMDLLAASERVKESLTWKVAQFALGRPLVAEDAAKLKEVHLVSQEGGGTYPSLMAAIVLSDLVQKTATATASATMPKRLVAWMKRPATTTQLRPKTTATAISARAEAAEVAAKLRPTPWW